MFGAEQQLGRPVPARDDVTRHLSVRVRKGPRETEIRQFDLPIRCDQQVVRLDIPMQHGVLMTEPDGPTQHAHPRLDIRRSVPHPLRILDQHLQITQWQEFQHEVQVLVFGAEDAVQRDDVRMRELLQVLQFADRIRRHTFRVFFLDLDLFDGDEGGG